ncbi:N-acetyltransferase [Pediococcus parvulus]|uniref:GNAT family N-acetyltransferase n=2 Tax=Pediococcus parvulus TaxID=54062 RepID=A0AAP5TAG9_9LACO|nr:N-acetyltransferase [Pediococcus parvulus]MCT3034648.1 N-acetyltransferase [Pediococcus parvulus]MDV7694199.1 GNAT family N-acetyltransferase [Pediococcus parvulus]
MLYARTMNRKQTRRSPMERFEKYHPILTTHYTLDWLTATKVKDIYALRHDTEIAAMSGRHVDADINETVAYVNKTMRNIMHNDSLLWGISDRKTDEFLGTFCIWNFNKEKTTAEVGYEILAAQQNHGIMSEVLQHMSNFAFAELGLTTLYAITGQANVTSQAVLTKNKFRINPNYPGEKETVSFSLTAPEN